MQWDCVNSANSYIHMHKGSTHSKGNRWTYTNLNDKNTEMTKKLWMDQKTSRRRLIMRRENGLETPRKPWISRPKTTLERASQFGSPGHPRFTADILSFSILWWQQVTTGWYLSRIATSKCSRDYIAMSWSVSHKACKISCALKLYHSGQASHQSEKPLMTTILKFYESTS